MSNYKTYDVNLEADYLKNISNTTPFKGIEEAIWNSLDADASEIYIKFNKNELGGLSEVIVEDNGHGIEIDKVESEFTTLGGSFKKTTARSPKNRKYHGSQGAGRLKLSSIGDNINIYSTYYDKKEKCHMDIEIHMDGSNLKKFEILSLEKSSNNITGTRIKISDLSTKSSILTTHKTIEEIAEIFTAYNLNYPDFTLTYNGVQIDFQKSIKNTYTEDFSLILSNQEQFFTVKIIEWKKANFDRKICFCNETGIALEDKHHRLRLQSPLSIYILSEYFNKLQQNGGLLLEGIDKTLIEISDKARNIAKQYDLARVHEQAKEYIDELKKEDIYPYKSEPQNAIEKIEQQVFDVTALQLKRYLPIDSNKQATKRQKAKDKLTLSLIKEAISSSPTVVSKIIKAILGLTNNEQSDFAELLERTTLSAIINTSKEISDRLIKLEGFKDIIIGGQNDKILERKHLQKLLEQEYWIFGDNYQLGATDNTLKTVLEKYLTHLGRTDFKENVIDEKDSHKIPDICLWKQYKKDYFGNKENLVIEIKKPTLKVGMTEVTQVLTYANKIIEDPAFPKEKTTWTFYLLTNDYDSNVAHFCNQKDREPGLGVNGDHHKIYIKRWSEILNDAEARLSYLQDKLNLQVEENEGVNLLKKLHPDYLPNNIADKINV